MIFPLFLNAFSLIVQRHFMGNGLNCLGADGSLRRRHSVES